jgi:muramoyltetrapeptide carboxypeptidase LdcA involved in peptidoglycan recycling
MKLIKPKHLCPGDTIATVSPSSGVAGDEGVRLRYDLACSRLRDVFGLNVVAMPHTLSGSDYVYRHPRERAGDLMQAFADPDIKGVFSTLGGDDTLRLLPYIDYQVIHDNPKVFIGYSDTTANHFMCYHAGLSSFYGPSVLVDFAEGGAMCDYTVDYLRRAVFSNEPIGKVEPSSVWTSEQHPWDEAHLNYKRRYQPNTGYEVIQGSGIAQGHLIGGNLEVMDWMRGTEIFPAHEDLNGAILFLESSFGVTPDIVRYALRALGVAGVFDGAAAILVGKPLETQYYDDYKKEYIDVTAEFGRSDIPIMYNMGFGHCCPRITIPYGALARINCADKSFEILDAGCF